MGRKHTFGGKKPTEGHAVRKVDTQVKCQGVEFLRHWQYSQRWWARRWTCTRSGSLMR
jgi:hypothetical protein